MPEKSNKSRSATDLHIKTELSDSKEVRFFDIPVLAYSWRNLISLIHNEYFFHLQLLFVIYFYLSSH